MEGVCAYFGADYTGARVAGFEGQFGYVPRITFVNTSKSRSYEIQIRCHSHDCREYCVGSSASNCCIFYCGDFCDYRRHINE